MSIRVRGISVFTTLLLIAPGLYATEPWQGPYVYDGAGNIKSIGSNHYLYDGSGRLTEATAITGAQSSVKNYYYDAFGNLKEIRLDGDVAHATIIGADAQTNRLTDSSRCAPGTICIIAAYDPAGHQITGGDAANYHYDAADMMSSLVSGGRDEVYIYDAQDQRLATVVNATTAPAWRYTLRGPSTNVTREYSASGLTATPVWTKDYVYRDGVLLAAVGDAGNGAESRTHFHVDHLSTARLVTDDEGRRVAEHTYWPFGIEAAGSDTDSEAMKYAGHERDFAAVGSTSDLDYVHARYYAPASGRFLSIDLAAANPARPQTWNRYSYVLNQPVNFSDVNGKFRTDFHHDVTQILALAAGYDSQDAAFLAYYTELPDHDFRNAMDLGSAVLNAGHSYDLRADFHFASPERLAEMKGAAESGGNFYEVGGYLHALQDSFSHAGFGPLVGHTTPLLRNPTPAGYRNSYDVDTTAKRPDVAFSAAQATFSFLTKLHGGKPKVTWAALSEALYGYLSTDEHDVKRQYYLNWLCHLAGCTDQNTTGYTQLTK